MGILAAFRTPHIRQSVHKSAGQRLYVCVCLLFSFGLCNWDLLFVPPESWTHGSVDSWTHGDGTKRVNLN